MTTKTTTKAPTITERVRALEETVIGQQELIRFLTQAVTGTTLPVAEPVIEPTTEPVTEPNTETNTETPGQSQQPTLSWAKRHERNTQQAAWMRDNGLVPNGTAWKAVQKGERNIAKLRKLNEADGHTPKIPGKASSTAQPQDKLTPAQVEVADQAIEKAVAPLTAPAAAKAPAKKAPANKPRKTTASKKADDKPKAADAATLQPRMVEPETPVPSIVDDLEPSVVAQLRADGLSDEDIALAYKLKTQG